MRITSSLRNPEPSDARSVTNSPCRCAATITKPCITRATRPHGGPMLGSHHCRSLRTFGPPANSGTHHGRRASRASNIPRLPATPRQPNRPIPPLRPPRRLTSAGPGVPITAVHRATSGSRLRDTPKFDHQAHCLPTNIDWLLTVDLIKLRNSSPSPPQASCGRSVPRVRHRPYSATSIAPICPFTPPQPSAFAAGNCGT